MPVKSGVYIFRGRKNEILYLGKANNLKVRVASYFRNKETLGPKTSFLVSRIHKIDYILADGELEALLLEASLIKTHQPFFNTRAKDDKHPLYIKITLGNEYPRIFTVRREEEPGSIYFGPFPSSQTVKQVLRLLRSIFPFDTQKTIGKRACFWSHLGLCNPCPSWIQTLPRNLKIKEKARYRKNIRHLVAVLSRKTDKVKKFLTREMLKKAREENFEEATLIRNQLSKLDYITKPRLSISSFLENPNLVSDIRSQELKALYESLGGHLNLKSPPRRLECFDASHTAISSPTVGMVTFINGEPEKSFYRRFRIKKEGIDDLAFLEEALTRRFTHKEWGLPDLLVIDGGKTQVGRAREVMKKLRIKLPVIGIVKPFDNLVIPKKQGFLILHLKETPALHLLERLRDEAHRYALSYHRKLRAKNLF